MQSSSDIEISELKVMKNSTGKWGEGGGGLAISKCGAKLVITGVDFRENHASDGGGLKIADCPDIELQGLTFTENTASYSFPPI